jgi:hypothetical protein
VPATGLTIAIEGPSDEAVLRRVAQHVGVRVDRAYGKQGKNRLDKNLPSYLLAAQYSQWLVLRDLDHDADCAPELVRRLMPGGESPLILRVVVRSIEAWLLADRERIAAYLGVRQGKIPAAPEELERPKRTVVDLAASSSKRSIRLDMVPARGLSAEVGPAYTGRLIDFAVHHWRPEVAARVSGSLAGCLRALRSLA